MRRTLTRGCAAVLIALAGTAFGAGTAAPAPAPAGTGVLDGGDPPADIRQPIASGQAVLRAAEAAKAAHETTQRRIGALRARNKACEDLVRAGHGGKLLADAHWRCMLGGTAAGAKASASAPGPGR